MKDALQAYFDEWELVLPHDAREALRTLVSKLRAPVADAVPVKASNIDTRDVDVEVHAFGSVFYDHGPNLAEALGRLAQRVARWRNLPAPSLASAPVAGEDQKPVRWMMVERRMHSEPEYTKADPTGICESVYVPLYAAPQANKKDLNWSGVHVVDNQGFSGERKPLVIETLTEDQKHARALRVLADMDVNEALAAFCADSSTEKAVKLVTAIMNQQ